MVVRDEEDLIQANIEYHAFIGFTSFVVVDHRSIDQTSRILAELQRRFALEVVRDDRREFDHEELANRALQVALRRFDPDWVFPLDADEFFCAPAGLQQLLARLAERGISYASAKWLVAVPQKSRDDRGLAAELFYEPWPERPWQAEGHFRKSFCRSHTGMSIVAGGHYFRREVNASFFCGRNFSPHLCGQDEAYILHFEARLSPARLLQKWQHLGSDLVEPNYSPDALWNEKVERIREYASHAGGGMAETLHTSESPMTFWGSHIPDSRLHRRSDLHGWLAQFVKWPASKGGAAQ